MDKRSMSKKHKDNLSFLFSRMTWLSLMVRERACTAIAELLVDKKYSSVLRKSLESWMKEQQLESISVLGLLVLIRAKIISKSFTLPSYEKISEMLSKPSLLSYLLLKQLGYDNILKPDYGGLCLSEPSQDFKPSHFFQKYCSNYLPPAYNMKAFEIERKYNIDFRKHWAFEWEILLKNTKKSPSSEPLHFMGRPEDENYGPVDFELSEVYRSAYLRTLAWTVAKNILHEEDATYYAVQTCPVDPSLWKVNSQFKPQWWPILKPQSGVIDTSISDIWQQVDDLWSENQKAQNGRLLAQANGRVSQTDSIYDLEIRGFFQKCYGNKKPDLEEVLSASKSQIIYYPRSIGVDGYIRHESEIKYEKSIGDWSVLPATCQIWPYTTPRWQSRILERGIWVPAPFLANDVFEIGCVNESLNVIHGKDIVAKWQDWNWNLREKHIANLTSSAGEYLLVEKAMVEKFIKSENYKFCWICRLIQFYREQSYELYKTRSYFQEYGTTNIII
jgi:hypothetical protein